MPQEILLTGYPDGAYFRSGSRYHPKRFLAKDENGLAPHERVGHFYCSFGLIEEVVRAVNGVYSLAKPRVPVHAYLFCSLVKSSCEVREESFCFYYVVCFAQPALYFFKDYVESKRSFGKEVMLLDFSCDASTPLYLADFYRDAPEIVGGMRFLFQSTFDYLL